MKESGRPDFAKRSSLLIFIVASIVPWHGRGFQNLFILDRGCKPLQAALKERGLYSAVLVVAITREYLTRLGNLVLRSAASAETSEVTIVAVAIPKAFAKPAVFQHTIFKSAVYESPILKSAIAVSVSAVPTIIPIVSVLQ